MNKLNSKSCAEIIRKSSAVRENLFNSLKDKAKFNKFKEYYSENKELYPLLNDLSTAKEIDVLELKKLFKDYEAHHVIPVNVIKGSENLQEILAYAKQVDFDFNDIDNLIFLHKENHSGSHGEYDKQIIKIVDGIDIDNLDKAVDKLTPYFRKQFQKNKANSLKNKAYKYLQASKIFTHLGE